MSNETSSRPSIGRRIYDTIIGDRDIGVMLIVATLLYTVNVIGTIGAMRYLLPPEAAVFSGFLIVTIIFAAEAKYIARHAPFIRKLVVIVFIPVTVLAMHSSYYLLAAKLRDAGTAVSHASSPYSDLVNLVYSPNKAMADSLMRRAQEKYEASERERTAGSGTGKTGYGPRAQALQREGDELRDQAAPYLAQLDLMRPYAELDPAVIGPEKTYEAALALWRVTDEAWKRLPDSECATPPCTIPKPTREEFVDEAAESPLLTPMRRALQGDWLSILLLVLASGLDGLVLLLGTAIVKTEEPKTDTRSFVHRVADGFLGARQASKTLQYARKMPVEHIDIRDPLRTMHVRVVGESHAADFWNLLYRHTHPLSGRFDWRAILEHEENESYKDMARWWIDAARANGLLVDTGAEDENEALYYPEDSYYPTTGFYREMHLREVAHRDGLPEVTDDKKPERVMRVLLPEPIKRKEGEPVKLMRPLSTASSKKTTVAATTVTAQAPVTPLRGSSVPVVAAPGALRAASQTIVPDDTPRTAQPAPTPTTTRSPMAFARGGSYAHSTAHTTAPQLRVVTPPPPDVTAGAPTLEADEVTVQSAPVRVDAPVSRLQAPTGEDPPLVPVEDEIATTLVVEDSEDAPVDAVAQNPDEEDTHPSIMMDVAELPPVVEEPIAEVVPEPTPVPAPVAAPVAAMAPPPEWDPDMWEDKPTATRGVSRAKLRAATMDGAAGQTGIRDDALRTGSLVRLSYMTKPPRTQNGGDAYAPRVRAHLRQAAAEALARGGK